MEAYHLYKDGYDWNLSPKDIDMLDAVANTRFAVITTEEELIEAFYSVPKSDDDYEYKTATDIKRHIEHNSNQKLYPVQLGKALSKLGFERSKQKGIYKWKIKEKIG